MVAKRESLVSKKFLSPSVQKVQDALLRFGLSVKIKEFPEGTETAVDAARAIGCQIEQIAKSLIFKTMETKQPILVVASGVNRVNERIISDHIGQEVEIADADFVLEKTGFATGGIPPIGHLQPIKTFIDEDLLGYPEIWAAGGNSNTVFKLTPEELERITQGKVISIK